MAIGVSKSKIITVKTDHECPNCKNSGSLYFVVKSSYLRIVFIPFFTLGKSVSAECGSCNKTFSVNQMPVHLQSEALKEKNYHQNPVWHFSGLIFVIAFLPTIISDYTNLWRYNYNYDFESYNDNSFYEEEEIVPTPVNSYIVNPEIGDIYEYTISRGNYSTMKVIDVSYDSVFVTKNIITTNSMTYVDDINIEENYPEESFGISMEALEEMYLNHTIYHIERPSL